MIHLRLLTAKNFALLCSIVVLCCPLSVEGGKKVASGSLSVSGTANFAQLISQNYQPQIEARLGIDIAGLLNISGNSTVVFYATTTVNTTTIASSFDVIYEGISSAVLADSWKSSLDRASGVPNSLPQLQQFCQGILRSLVTVQLFGQASIKYNSPEPSSAGCGPFSCFAIAMCVIFGLIIVGIVILCVCMMKKRKEDAKRPPQLPAARARAATFTDTLLGRSGDDSGPGLLGSLLGGNTEPPPATGGSVRKKSVRRRSTIMAQEDDEPFTYEAPSDARQQHTAVQDDFDPLSAPAPSPKDKSGGGSKVKFDLDEVMRPPPDVIDDDFDSWGPGPTGGPRFA